MKKIFTLLFFIFLFNAIFCSHVFAQNNVSSLSGGVVVASVNITNAKIVSQKDRDFVISFNISNKTGAQPQVKYSVKLVKTTPTSQSILDEKVYDNILFLGENMTISKTINYSIPASIPAGTYSLYVQSKNNTGLPLAIASLGDIKVKNNVSNFVEIVPDSCSFVTITKQASTSESVIAKAKNDENNSKPSLINTVDETISPFIIGRPDKSTTVVSTSGADEITPIVTDNELSQPASSLEASSSIKLEAVFNIKCKIKSNFGMNTVLIPKFVTRSNSSFGPVAQLANLAKENIIIKKGINDVSFEVPKATKPQSYNLSFSLISSDEKIISNTITYDYVVAGQSGIIKNVIFDKTYYKVGDTANIQIFSQQTGTGTIAAIIKNDKGISCSATTSTEVSNFSIKNFLIPIKNDCLNPKINVILSSGTTILDSQNFQTISSANTTNSPKTNFSTSKIIIIIILIVIALILGALIYKKKYFGLKILIFIFVFLFASFGFTKISEATSPCVFTSCSQTPAPAHMEYLGTCSVPGTQPYYFCNGTKRYKRWWGYGYRNQAPTYSNGVAQTCTLFYQCEWGCSGTPNYTGDGLCEMLVHISYFSSNSVIPINTATTLSWSSINDTGGSCSITKNGYSFASNLPTTGSISSGSLASTAEFVVTCTSVAGSRAPNSSSQGFVVNVVSPPTISNIQINPNPVSYNGYTNISADVSNAGSCTVTGNGNTVVWNSPTSITFYVTNMTATTSFEISCSGGGGTEVSDIEVGVLPRPSLSVSMYPASTTVSKNSATTIYWNSTGADSCQINGSNVPTSGEMSSGDLTSTTTYTINCINNPPPQSLPSFLPDGAILAVDPGLSFNDNGSYYGYQAGQTVSLKSGINPNLPDSYGGYYYTGWGGSVNIDVVNPPPGGVIDSELINGGEGYSVGDILTIIGGGDSTAQVQVAETDGPAGAIREIDLLSGGSGYEQNDQLTIQGGNNNGIINVDSVDENGAVTGISVIDRGSGYISNNMLSGFYTPDVVGGHGSGIVVTVGSVYGTITSLYSHNPISPGMWYNVGDELPLDIWYATGYWPNDSAKVKILQVGRGIPRSVSVADPGSGYVAGMSYLMDGPGNISVLVTKVQGATNNLTNPDQGTYAAVESSSTSIVIGVQDTLSSPRISLRVKIPEIKWDVTDATSCVLKNDAGETISTSMSGTIIDYTLSTGHTFTLECSGPGGTSSASSTSSFPELSSTCSAFQITQIGDLYVNKNTKWTTVYNGTGTISSTIWSGDDIPNPITTDKPELNKIYTTVGTKTIHAASTITGAGDPFTSYCSTSTIMKLDKGTINEI